jgi:hypothetical protein
MDNHALMVTRWLSRSGTATCYARPMPWSEFVEALRNEPRVEDKNAGELVKLARFGNRRSEVGALRHDGNVLEVHGIEADYDAGVVAPHTALRRLEAAGIRAVVSTTFSHDPDRPRWRVFAPLSAPVAPRERHRLVGLLNGVLGGILGRESFVLSQSYYVGARPEGEYLVLPTFGDPEAGEFIDQLGLELALYPGKNGDGPEHVQADAVHEPRTDGLRGDWRTLDVVGLFQAHNLYGHALEGRKHSVTCPWQGEHTAESTATSATVIYESTETTGPAFKCLHAHCRDSRDIRAVHAFFGREEVDRWCREPWTRPVVEDHRTSRHGVPRGGEHTDTANAAVDPSQNGRERHENVTTAGVQLGDFYAYMPMHQYIFAPSREMWPASSVNARILPIGDVKANLWLDQNQPVEQMSWVPGEPMLITDRIIADGGWIARPGCTCFNLYRPPVVRRGDAAKAGPWIAHWHHIYPSEAEHLIAWLAHRVQRPGEKINHALVLGGPQGIGKDTGLEPVKAAVAPWNFSEVSPAHLLGRFNGFVKSVILRVSEARDLGDVDRYGFYDHMKTYTAAPPDVLRCDEKNLREHAVPNVCGVIITTNHKSDGIYLPADDRRHFVAWTDLTKDDFPADYWTEIWTWYRSGGVGHVAAYLAELDLSDFDPKAPPPKTSAFWDIVDANRAPEDAELADALDRLGAPKATTLTEIAERAEGGFADWIRDRRNSRNIPHRMEAAGYVPVRNDGQADGRWKIGGKNQVVYARHELTVRDRIAAARRLAEAAR